MLGQYLRFHAWPGSTHRAKEVMRDENVCSWTSHPGAGHASCLFDTLEIYLRDAIRVLIKPVQKCEERFSVFVAGSLRLLALISADRTLAALLAGIIVCTAVLVTLLLALTSPLLR